MDTAFLGKLVELIKQAIDALKAFLKSIKVGKVEKLSNLFNWDFNFDLGE